MSPDTIGKLLALTCAFVWAFAVILFKRSGETMSPLALNLYKTSIAGLTIFPLWLLTEPELIPSTLSSADLGLLAISGILGITIADSLFFFCLNRVGAGYYAILDCIYSPSMIALSWLMLDEPFSLRHVAGAGLVISGVLLVSFDQKTVRRLPVKIWIQGASAGLAGILLMVFSIILVKPLLDTHSAVLIVECRMLPAIVGLHLIALFRKERWQLYRSLIRKRAFILALPGTLLGNVISMLTWVAAFKYTDLGSASILNQTSVIFVVILAAIFLKETLDRQRIIATILGFAGSVVILGGCL
ncbi:DMT family transporter [bacterium]|nr:DMT family transporter [candidate division CSSED10-310 bacterium]